MEKELSRFELAIVKRTAQNTKALRTKRDKAKAKIEALTAELQEIEAVIEKFEAPVKEITGGLTSEEVLAELAKAETVEDSTEEIYESEVPATPSECVESVESATTCANEMPWDSEQNEACEAAEMPWEDTNN